MSYNLHKDFKVFIPEDINSDKFSYTDGRETEIKLKDILTKSSDLSANSNELNLIGDDWVTYYHLSSTRSNLLRPLRNLLNDKNILEIGGGCGAITRYLGEIASNVTSIEGSLNRAEINSIRCKDLDTVSIVCDKFSNYSSQNKFDIVTIIGVLEYARVYSDSTTMDDPIELFLKKANSHLNDNGFLILAIENKLGLKYFSGYPEDHLGISMFGLQGLYDSKSPVTFGKQELCKKLKETGFNSLQFYYPFPDYKTPNSILTDNLKGIEDDFNLTYLLSSSERKDFQKPAFQTFSLPLAWDEIYKNGLWQDLSNSFLIVASKKNIHKENALAYYYAIEDKENKQKEYIFQENKTITYNINKEVNRLKENWSEYKTIPFINGNNWEQKLNSIILKPNWQMVELIDWIKVWIEAIANEHNLKFSELNLNTTIHRNYIDAIPRNLIVLSNSKNFIDLESLINIDFNFKFLLFRSLFYTIWQFNNIANPNFYIKKNYKFNLIILIFKNLNFLINKKDFKEFLNQEIELLKSLNKPTNALSNIDKLLKIKFKYCSDFDIILKSLQSGDFKLKDSNLKYSNSKWIKRFMYIIKNPIKGMGLLKKIIFP